MPNHNPSRRGLLAGAALASLAAVPVLGQSRPATGPAKGGELKITDVQTFTAGRLYVRVVTDGGIDGWGEVNSGPAEIHAAVVNAYKPLLVGQDPTRVEHLWQTMHRAHRNMRGGNVLVASFAGVDIALWDILGKLTNLPVYTLLGGPCRDKILFYPNAKAHKCTTHALNRMVETPANLDPVVNDLVKTREKLGKGGYLMLDGHGKFTATAAVQLCQKIDRLDLNLLYFEEVVPPEQNADLIRVKRATNVPLAAGERMATVWDFRTVFADQSADVLNADVVTIGGISQLHKLATIAELYDLPLAPHGTHSMVGLAASLHVVAAVNNFLIQECYPSKTDFLTGIDWPANEYFPLPPGPGLGVAVNLDGLKEAAAKAAEKGGGGVRKAYFLPDGSVADR